MKPSKPYGTYRPFKNLKYLLEKKSFVLAPQNKEKPLANGFKHGQSNLEEEKRLFQEAMAGVAPIPCENASIDMHRANPAKVSDEDPEVEALAQLENLVRDGKGFVVSDTPEYMEGIGYGVNPDVAKRLHRGDFSIQAHIDLHGLGVGHAQEAFEGFLKWAMLSGKRAVLVVHGRGLSSPEEPVLKAKVKEWLTCGRWRKWVIAFTSARACDGGAGATYVLLRQRPATKRYRRAYHKKRMG
ncbi:MAG: Smr/MutS family protein [Deltaproteobacteria bacterium]|nr:Smr/MutS family protein [Deltaproteobacteria bacterium]MBW2074726.1 Smr/MutS family protein [Deltaproteobacteria bacterium]RLB80852.1 MAG: DNA mismatch repair protein MutS [Deltaproteobacteria bacterium]